MNLPKYFLAVLMWCCLNSAIQAQSDSTNIPEITLSGFADVFYAFDFNQPEGNKRQDFLFNHNRHNEFNLNMAMLKLVVEHEWYRANIAFHAGTYAQDNYADEPGTLKNILEANVGLALDKKGTTWLDVGVFPSHLGFESALSIENPTLTRSLVAENSPYFLAGAKLTTQVTSWLTAASIVCNGWQRIQRVEENSLPGFGAQLVATPGENLLINYSVFIGTDDPDETRRMRYFHNLFAEWRINEKFKLIAGGDLGNQQVEKDSEYYQYWWGLTAILRYEFNEQWAAALRGEYYDDEANVIIPAAFAFQTSGLSLNFDYTPVKDVALRVEGRWFRSRNRIFSENEYYPYDNWAVVASLAVKINRKLK